MHQSAVFQINSFLHVVYFGLLILKIDSTVTFLKKILENFTVGRWFFKKRPWQLAAVATPK